MTRTLWCELAWLGGETPETGVLVELDGDRLATVSAGYESAPDGAETLTGLTMPGLANAHSHAFQRALRGRTQRPQLGSFWMWRKMMTSLAANLDARGVERLARAAFGEMALAGITLVGEFDYLHHSTAILSAARAAGVRLTLIDACYLEGGVPCFHDPSATAWRGRVEAIEPGPGARVAAAIHSVRAVPPDAASIVAEAASEHGWALHAHVSEQPGEHDGCHQRYGATPLQVLDRAGALSPRFTAVHATHFEPADGELLAANEAFTCLCPTTERDLGDGIGRPYGRLTLGSDSQAVIDLFEEARAVELDERLRSGARGTYPTARLATAATADGYASLGWPEGGRIAPGALADLTTVRLDSVRLAGTRPQDALDAVIFAAGAPDVDRVIVGGRDVVVGGRHVDLDVPALLARAIPER